jgi:hypothetical protein
MVEEAQKEFLVNKRKFAYATAENIIGKLYIEVAKGTTLNLSLAKNIKFLIKNVPFASKRAEKHLNRCILMAKDFGADLLLGHAYLDLGTLNMNKNRYVQARNYITKAVPIFESCGADAYLQQAHEMLQEIAE